VAPQISRSPGPQRSLTVTTLIVAAVGVALYLFLFATSRETVRRRQRPGDPAAERRRARARPARRPGHRRDTCAGDWTWASAGGIFGAQGHTTFTPEPLFALTRELDDSRRSGSST